MLHVDSASVRKNDEHLRYCQRSGRVDCDGFPRDQQQGDGQRRDTCQGGGGALAQRLHAQRDCPRHGQQVHAHGGRPDGRYPRAALCAAGIYHRAGVQPSRLRGHPLQYRRRQGGHGALSARGDGEAGGRHHPRRFGLQRHRSGAGGRGAAAPGAGRAGQRPAGHPQREQRAAGRRERRGVGRRPCGGAGQAQSVVCEGPEYGQRDGQARRLPQGVRALWRQDSRPRD